MAAFAANHDFEFVAGCHDRPGAHRKTAHGVARPVVHAKHCLHGESLKQAVLNHFACAAPTFFSGLENQINGAIKITVLRKMLSSSQKHGGVPIVATGVHFAGDGTGVGKGVELAHGQSIHIGTQAHGPSTSTPVASLHNTHHARATQPTVDWDTPFAEFGGHQIGRAVFFKTQLGVGVDIAP